ncbi:hypothetical protein V8E54_003696 [Elaphomyces granulatus]
MTSCVINGNSDMYGLGIRVGFYLQWYGAILASWIAPSEINALRFSNSLFVGATFLALIIQTAESELQPVEIYIILLLAFGYYLYFVPLFLWRLVTGCSPHLDPSRWPRKKQGTVFSVLNFILLGSVSVFQMWFWANQIAHPSDESDCEVFAFAFIKVRLDNQAFNIFNIVLYTLLLVTCIFVLSVALLVLMNWIEEDKGAMPSAQRKKMLRHLESTIRLIVAVVVTVATELTIQWNNIEDVQLISSAGQTIPLLLGFGSFARVCYIYFKKKFYDSTEDSSDEELHPNDFIHFPTMAAGID